MFIFYLFKIKYFLFLYLYVKHVLKAKNYSSVLSFSNFSYNILSIKNLFFIIKNNNKLTLKNQYFNFFFFLKKKIYIFDEISFLYIKGLFLIFFCDLLIIDDEPL